MYQCASCGRENDSRTPRCVACGEPIHPAAARAVPSVRHTPPSTMLAGAALRATPRGVAPRATPVRGSQRAAPAVSPCPHCGRSSERTHPFCPFCGLRTSYTPLVAASCSSCGGTVRPDGQGFCATCGAPIAVPGADQRRWTAPAADQFEASSGDTRWVYIDQPHTLCDGDRLRIGSQLIRFRRLDDIAVALERPVLGSGSLIPNVDVGVLEQMRPDGTTRNTIYLAAERSVLIGREQGDWVFPYDPAMSPRHAEVRVSGAQVTVRDLASRTGVAIVVRGGAAMPIAEGSTMDTQAPHLERD